MQVVYPILNILFSWEIKDMLDVMGNIKAGFKVAGKLSTQAQ